MTVTSTYLSTIVTAECTRRQSCKNDYNNWTIYSLQANKSQSNNPYTIYEPSLKFQFNRSHWRGGSFELVDRMIPCQDFCTPFKPSQRPTRSPATRGGDQQRREELCIISIIVSNPFQFYHEQSSIATGLQDSESGPFGDCGRPVGL